MIKEELMEWSKNIDDSYKEICEYIDNHKLPDVVSFEESSTKKGLYQAYSNIVNISNKISEFSMLVSSFMMMKIIFKKRVADAGYASYTGALYKYIDNVVEKIGVLENTLFVYKNGIDNQLRFYQSVQYILSSPRLEAYE